MSHHVDINADLGEGFPWDLELLKWVTSTSISCGAHAGLETDIQRTMAAAIERGLVVGAHPGYPDRAVFGRKERAMTSQNVRDMTVEQVSSLASLCEAAGGRIRFLKPHGALYNQAQRAAEIGDGVLDAAELLSLPLLGQAGSRLHGLAGERGLPYITEGFPDRRYLADGTLAPRSAPDALLYDPVQVAENLSALLASGFQTLCVHGDDPRALDQARLIHKILNELGWTTRSFLI